MPKTTIINQMKIESRKPFNLILVSLKTAAEVLKNIDQLCSYAARCGNMNMLRNTVRLKAPEIHEAFTDYLSTHSIATLNTETGYLLNTKKTVISNHPPFVEWAKQKQLIPANLLEDSMKAKSIKPMRVLNKGKIDNNSCCPYCCQKLPHDSIAPLANHTCRNTKSKGKSLWTISGGGGPGTGKRS